ncbi:MAG: CHASE2 domain-containing protein [Chitinivibrionales bacterium]|nr:CHASE2 domain-containing protein [Chitinivibrionales bacterium]
MRPASAPPWGELPMGFLKKLLRALLVGAVAGVGLALVFSFVSPQLFDRLEYLTYYVRCNWIFGDPNREQREALANREPDVCIIDIDDRSMEDLGNYWAWNRGYHGKMLRSLAGHFPAAVGFDIMFDNPEDSKYMERFDGVLERVSGDVGLDEDLRRRILTSVVYDQELIDATRAMGTVYHAVRMAEERDYAMHALSQIRYRMTRQWHENMNPSSSLSLPMDSTVGDIESKPILDGCFTSLARASRAIGHVNIPPNEDGVVREVPLLLRFDSTDAVYLPLSVRMGVSLFGTPNEEVRFAPGKYLDIGTPFKIGRDEDGELWCSYPHLRPAQVRMLIEQAPRILACEPGDELQISSFVSVHADSAGRPWLIIDADTIAPELTETLMQADYEAIGGLGEGDRAVLDSQVVLVNDGGGVYTLTAPYGAEVWYLWDSHLATLRALAHEWDSLAASRSPTLLYYPLRVRNAYGELLSTVPVLREDVLREVCRTPWERIEALEPGERIDFGEPVRMPLTRDNTHILTYFGPARLTFKRYSYSAIMRDEVQGGLAAKVFLVGSTAPGLFDFVPAPVDNKYPGVETHASLLRSLLTNTFVRRLPVWADLLVLVAVGMLVGVVTFAFVPLAAALATGVFIAGYVLLSVGVFSAGHLWIEVARPVLAMIFSFTAVMAYRYITEERDRKFLHSTFKTYLAPELIDQMYRRRAFPKLGGEERVMTAYFTDIQSFSTFSEKLGSPTRLVELLNEYLTAMTDILLQHRGTLDKYEGDAILAFFGAPMPMEDHAHQACLSALAMQERLRGLREKWAGEGDKWPAIVSRMRMRIGINTGAITVGNMGTPTRMDYTMMGDAVNLAARLESAAKQYGVYTMISNHTYEPVKDEFIVRQLDKIQVVGRSEPVVVYELLAQRGKLSTEYQPLLDRYNQALALFYAREWERAEQILATLEQQEPLRDVAPGHMSPSRRILNLCRMYRQSPPGPDWDGVTRLTTK